MRCAEDGLLPQTHPQLKIILYISGSGGLLERMAACSPDIMSIDQHVDMRDAIQRIGPKFAVQVRPGSHAHQKVASSLSFLSHLH